MCVTNALLRLYFENVWAVNHSTHRMVLEFSLTLNSVDFPDSELTFGLVEFEPAREFHELYRDAGEAVQRAYLSNPLSLDAQSNRIGHLAFLAPDDLPLVIPHQQYGGFLLEARDVHADESFRIDGIGRHRLG